MGKLLWGLLGLIVLSAAINTMGVLKAQAPSGRPGCVFNSVLPTLADKQTVALQCDTNGKLRVP